MTTRPRRVALIGCGDISALHLAAVAGMATLELVAVCDSDAERLALAVRALGVPGFATHNELFESTNPDAVHITTPHHTHASIAIDALDRGIHVILEKPLAHTFSEGERIVAAANRGSAKIAVCFQNRYNAPVQAAKAVLDSGELGAIRGAAATVLWHRTAEYYRDRPWRGQWDTAGGGLLMNQAIHTLDLLQWFIGPVVGVHGSASTRALGDVIAVEDTAEMVLTHKNGVSSVFFATLAHSSNRPVTLVVELERGTLTLSGDLTITRADGTEEIVKERPPTDDERAYWGVSHELLIADFYDRLDEPQPFWINPSEALKTLAVIQDVYDQSYPERAALETISERNGNS